MKVYAISLGFILGIFCLLVGGFSVFIFGFIAVLGLVCCLFYKRFFIAGLFLLSLSFGGVYTTLHVEKVEVFHEYLGTNISLEGKVISEIDERENSVKFVLLHEDTKVLVSTEKYSDISFGDVILVEGVLKTPEKFETDTGRIFHYDTYLAKDDIFYTVSFANVTRVKDGSFSFRGVLFSIKHFFLHNIQQSIPEPHAALGGGITVGAKQSLGDVLLHAFQVTGLIHIVVLSGYNVTIIAEAIMRFLGFLPKKISIGLGIVTISLFVILVGAGATIVRAGIMAALALIARATRRTYALTRALIIAGVIMLLFNPLILVYDPSFQLSFIATLGLIHIAPHIEKLFMFLPNTFGLREIVGATIGTQIAVFPLLLYLTGLFSISALPANLLVLPTIPFAMLFTLVAGIFGGIPGVGVLFGYPAYLLLSYTLYVVEVVSKVPGAAIVLPVFPFWVTLLIYTFIVWFFWRR
ncbi:MAG: ComEC/Rec2 family competence protein [Patescibacteria group bacterium UBA2103]